MALFSASTSSTNISRVPKLFSFPYYVFCVLCVHLIHGHLLCVRLHCGHFYCTHYRCGLLSGRAFSGLPPNLTFLCDPLYLGYQCGRLFCGRLLVAISSVADSYVVTHSLNALRCGHLPCGRLPCGNRFSSCLLYGRFLCGQLCRIIHGRMQHFNLVSHTYANVI